MPSFPNSVQPLSDADIGLIQHAKLNSFGENNIFACSADIFKEPLLHTEPFSESFIKDGAA